MTPQSHSCRSALIGSTGIAELPPRGQGGFFPGHPVRHESVREQLQVFLDFVIETIITWLFAQKPAHPRRERPQPRLSTCPAYLSLVLFKPQHAADHGGNALPVFRFHLELLPAAPADGIELRLAVVLGVPHSAVIHPCCCSRSNAV
jgi:hypothetical protein